MASMKALKNKFGLCRQQETTAPFEVRISFYESLIKTPIEQKDSRKFRKVLNKSIEWPIFNFLRIFTIFKLEEI